ncbi:MAG: RpiB/LacA/LacB family sugar-phosphate isomerase [Alphaproteobacteria bacterium]|nr:RpiB/LacA/LacB family sugar-phosphate isomerase [Alphaproteobacteria bacterium]
MAQQTIAFAADHRGFALKTELVAYAGKQGYGVLDLGTDSEERCDSIDYALKMAQTMAAGKAALGILICGTGNGIAQVANRYKSIICAVCHNSTLAKLARQHNDANVMALGAHVIGREVALDCLDAFVKTDFLGGRYGERREKLAKLGGL